MGSTTLTVRIEPKLKDLLGRLATHTQRSKSFLAGQAIAGYVERELQIIEGIERGLEDMRAGRVIPHEEVMAQIDAIIETARAKQEDK